MVAAETHGLAAIAVPRAITVTADSLIPYFAAHPGAFSAKTFPPFIPAVFPIIPAVTRHFQWYCLLGT